MTMLAWTDPGRLTSRMSLPALAGGAREPAHRFRRGATAVRVAPVNFLGEEPARDAAGLRQLEPQARQRPGAGKLHLLGGEGRVPRHVAEQLEGQVGAV